MTVCSENRTGFCFNNPDVSSSYHAPGWGLLVTSDDLRYDQLFGNPLIAEADSQYFTDEQLLDYARQSISWLEMILNIHILPRRIRYQPQIDDFGNEIIRADINDTDFISRMTPLQKTQLYLQETGYSYKSIAVRQECFIRLRHRPLRKVLTANFVNPFNRTTILDLMPFRVEKKGFSSRVNFVLSRINSGNIPATYRWQDFIFGGKQRGGVNRFLIDYETGYENCQDVPIEFRYIILKFAACLLMNTYGDGKLSAIANRSVSLSGVSESIGTTLSATSAAFGARIIQYQKEIKEFEKNKAKYSNQIFGNLGN